MNTRDALILLNCSGVIGSAAVKKLTVAFGSPEAAIGKSARAFMEAGLSPDTAAKVASLREDDLDKERARAEEKNVRIVTVADAGYPKSLKNIFSPPQVLYCKGELDSQNALAIAIVGSRHGSLYGLSTAKAFAAALAERGFIVVSGMARGIDTQAHMGALEKGGRTIAVMGSGFNYIYPRENRKLAETIERSGCVVTEFSMNTGPLKHNFPRRNRVISGLALGVLVVEAARNSGALITADFALEQGREVFAIPGTVDSHGASGSNNLIKEGAKLVSSVDDIIEEFSFVPAIEQSRESFVPRSGRWQRKPENAEEARVYAILSGEGVSMDELCRKSGMGVCKLSGLLMKMQLQRLIRKIPGNRFSRN